LASAKTAYIAEQSLRKFFIDHQVVYYWTFTIKDLCTKSEAERRFKPFKDLIRRKGGTLLEFWELQERGAWHVHLVTDLFIDVNWLRPWMVERGWGQQMKVKRVQAKRVWVDGEGWILDDRALWGLVKYLCKYLLKCYRSTYEAPASWGKKKVFGGSDVAKIGNTRFAWIGKITGKPGAMFWHYGRQIFRELHGEWPSWASMSYVLRLGYEACNWEAFDPFYQPP